MSVIEPQQGEPALGALAPLAPSNRFAPPRSAVESKVRRGKLLPHEKAGRVIRLMAWLGALGTVGIGAALILPTLSMHDAMPFQLIALIGVCAASTVGLFFVAHAVLQHKPWGRVAGIVYGTISLLGVPIGTIIGLYVLWHLVFGWNVSADA
jgi:hypothetical protein